MREKVAITEKAIEKCQNMIIQSQTMMEKICQGGYEKFLNKYEIKLYKDESDKIK